MTPPTDEAPEWLDAEGVQRDLDVTDETRAGEPRSAGDAEWELQRALEGQNLYHGRWSTTPVGRATAMAVRHSLRQRGFDVLPAAAAPSLDVDKLDEDRIRHAWMILTGIHLDDSERWEPDRYNGPAFLKALFAEYARLSEKASSTASEGVPEL